MREASKRLPVIQPAADGCGERHCAACDVRPTCNSTKTNGRLAAMALAALIALAAIPLWFLPERGDASTEAGAPSSAAAAASPAMLVAAPVVPAPTICRGWPIAHGPRGPCENCHLVVDCAGADLQRSPASLPPLALPTITRNSLLPHEFAGACLHCHFIVEEGPTPVNLDNMASLPLTQTERRLVQAGQQVIPPSVLTRMNAPVLSYGTVLAHSFWGVCSNCHRVVDLGFGRGPDASQQALALGRTPLLQDGVSELQIANASIAPRSSLRPLISWWFGVLALVLFLVSMVYVAIKVYLGYQPKEDQKRLREALALKRWFRVHEWTSFGFAGAVVVHWLFSDLGSALLHVSLLLVVALTLSGALYRYRITALASKKSMRWIHTQRLLLYLLIVTTIAGHLFVFLMP